MSDSHDGHDEHGLGHIVPTSVFWNIFLILVFLTVVTVVVGKWRIWFAGESLANLFDFGTFNILVSMAIATVKAVLVGLYFMHLKYEDKFTWLYVVFPVFLIFVMMGGIAIDNPLRVKTYPAGAELTADDAHGAGHGDKHAASDHGDEHH